MFLFSETGRKWGDIQRTLGDITRWDMGNSLQ